MESKRSSRISVLVNDRKEAIDPKFRIMIPALSFSHCFSFLLAIFWLSLGAEAGCNSGFRFGGGWIGFGTIFCGVTIFDSFGHLNWFVSFLSCKRITRRITLRLYLSYMGLPCFEAVCKFMEFWCDRSIWFTFWRAGVHWIFRKFALSTLSHKRFIGKDSRSGLW